MGVVGAMLLAAINRRLTWPLVWEGMVSTMKLTSMVVFILLGSRVFSLVFQGLGGSHWIERTLTSLPGGQVGFLVFANVFIFIMAFFLDFFEIAFIIIPLLVPAAQTLGIDLVWFGALTAVTLQTAFLSPPVAMSAYYLKQVVKEWSLATIYNGMFQFMILQVICIGLVIYFPQIALWFPQTLQAAARSQQIPDEYKKIIEQQKKGGNPLEDDDWGKAK